MNFFQSQANARSQTKTLIVLFSLAVLSLVVFTNLLVMTLFGFLNIEEQAISFAYIKEQFDWATFGMISVAVVIFILVGSVYKISSLASGGKVVAESLGGDLITHTHDNLQYKVLLNVVEEMAIAAGTPVPPVYVLRKEEGINAFAAGFGIDDAVIGVTQGALDCFNREELQGVIAHEFSHIINGDMRLNMRLIGLLHGILLIGIVGYYIMRMSGSNSRSKNGNQLVFLGIGLLIIGYGGTFFGKLIKASVSRQREFLADASAVQFTRNNVGIADALKKIGGYSSGSVLETPEAQSVSHAFFSNALSNKFSSLFSTHPPLQKRIKRLDPSWKESFTPTHIRNNASVNQTNSKNAVAANLSTLSSSQRVSSSAGAELPLAPEGTSTTFKRKHDFTNTIGKLHQSQIELAKTYLANIPEQLLNLVRTPSGAQAYVYALLLTEPPHDITKTADNTRQWGYLATNLPGDVYFKARTVFALIQTSDIEHRLPILEIALPQMRQITRLRYEAMLQQMQYLIFFDDKLSIFEWSIANIVGQYLKTEFESADSQQIKQMSDNSMQRDMETILSVLFHEFCDDGQAHSLDRPSATQTAIISEAQTLLNIQKITLRAKSEVSIEDFAVAVNTLHTLDFSTKEKIIHVCVFAVTQDKVYSPQEHEVIRALAECLGCPMPPDTQRQRMSAS
jgi:Zn-dependent protease with chaperone function